MYFRTLLVTNVRQRLSVETILLSRLEATFKVKKKLVLVEEVNVQKKVIIGEEMVLRDEIL